MAVNELVPGVGRLSRSAVYSKRHLYKGRKTSEPKAAVETPAFKEVEVKGDKNGSTRRIPTVKAARFYPAEDVRKPKVSRKTAKPTKLRSAITPGTILILLAGRFRGKRVVFLKQLDSGLLLVTGPYKLNGVPLRRVNQAYVIATSTKVDIPELALSDKINDAFFAKEQKASKVSAEEEFFADGKPKNKEPLPEAKTSEQKAVDALVLEGVKKTAHLEKYLKASWGLSKGQFPHQLVF